LFMAILRSLHIDGKARSQRLGQYGSNDPVSMNYMMHMKAGVQFATYRALFHP